MRPSPLAACKDQARPSRAERVGVSHHSSKQVKVGAGQVIPFPPTGGAHAGGSPTGKRLFGKRCRKGLFRCLCTNRPLDSRRNHPRCGLSHGWQRPKGVSTATYRWHACVPQQENALLAAGGSDKPLEAGPAPPLPTGSGAHGLRGHLTALAGVSASRHALAECDPVRT